MNWEAWLRQAAKRPSDYEEANAEKTEGQIRSALNASDSLKGRPWRIYIKGSYANNTNVRLNYDVDIAVEYYGYFYYELQGDLAGKDKSAVGVVDATDPYTRADFKRDIEAALVEAFGRPAVIPGDIALRVRERRTTLPADVVPCWEYHEYWPNRYGGHPVHQVGSRVYPNSGGFKNNFPDQQRTNGTNKNDATGRRYKRMVRCFKKLQTYLVQQELITEELPSYLSECLVYNVTKSAFGHDAYYDDMRAVLAQIYNATMPGQVNDEWLEVNELRYLFRGGLIKPVPQIHRVASTAWDAMGLG